ncbi:MAG: hypothetical protein E6J47_04905 [Chloroflexi bacterium]|nr:MAG: hypothetical protein E6J47_04905 [Chloroflexota bacterium]
MACSCRAAPISIRPSTTRHRTPRPTSSRRATISSCRPGGRPANAASRSWASAVASRRSTSSHLDPSSRLAAILGETDPLTFTEVNSYHHQAIRPEDLAPGLRAAGTAPEHGGSLVEALEAEDPDDWLMGVQCHPERPELIGPEFERLWRAFVEAARSGRRRRS